MSEFAEVISDTAVSEEEAVTSDISEVSEDPASEESAPEVAEDTVLDGSADIVENTVENITEDITPEDIAPEEALGQGEIETAPGTEPDKKGRFHEVKVLKEKQKKERKPFTFATVTAAFTAFVMFLGRCCVSAGVSVGKHCRLIGAGTAKFLGGVGAGVWRIISICASALVKQITSAAKASYAALAKYSRLISAGVGKALYYIGHSAWTVFAEVFMFVFGLIASFIAAFFGAIFEWIAKKLKQPLYEVWCFIITPFAHAWGFIAHAHIRLKKARKRSFLHAVGSAIASFWHFLGGLGEIARFVFNYAAPVVSIIFLISLIRYASTLQYAISVNYNGSDIGTIENEATFKEAETLIQDKVTFVDNDQPIVVTPTFSVTVINMNEDEKELVNDIDLLSETMIETGEVSVVYAYGFYINDELIGVYSDEDMETIRAALNAKLGRYSLPNAIDVKFEDDIVISEGRFIEDVLTPADSALEIINGSTDVEAYYVVVRGDTISGICQSLGISREEFDYYNPNLAGGISRGDIVTYHYLEPHLNVLTSYYQNYDQVIERTTEYVESSRYEQYCEILLQHGSDGYENVTALITQTNGVETERVITSRTILEEMVPRRFRVGTKENTYLDDTAVIDALGTFCWPLAQDGYISTMPGYRAWDKSNHMALDIAGIPRGTDIYAACDGKVTFAGTHGAYGKLVIIDVGGGYECYYAHCSEIDVKEGDRVEKGDVIAHVGMTGSASGYHLHFEMHYNGSRINPLLALGGTGGHEIRQW